MMKLILCFFILLSLNLYSNEDFLEITARDGDGIYLLLQKYKLPQDDYYFNKFKELNPKKFSKYNDLFKGTKYKLPIVIKDYNSKSIRTSLGIEDFQLALDIQKYNEKIYNSKLIGKSFRASKKLYVPLKIYEDFISKKSLSKETEKEPAAKQIHTPADSKVLFPNLEITDNSLSGHIFYISSGHGGPDPGAIGTKDGRNLCEDEYAYDVSMRLAKKLLERSATVYMIVVDPNDGIRESGFLECDSDEYYFGQDTISIFQNTRLLKRAEIMNELYNKHKKTAKSQTALMIHVDSRYEEKRIDIFFYYKNGDTKGKNIAKILYSTIKDKYEHNQPGRGYYGTISTRNLLELRKTIPTSVYIELGNIQNPNDQVRFLDPNNRQAIANWLYLGLVKSVKK